MALEKGAFRCLQGAPPPIRISCVEHINEFKDCFRGCITRGGAETQCWATCFTPDALPKKSNEDRSKTIGKAIERPRADKASAKASKTSNATKDHSPREQSVSINREKLTRASQLMKKRVGSPVSPKTSQASTVQNTSSRGGMVPAEGAAITGSAISPKSKNSGTFQPLKQGKQNRRKKLHEESVSETQRLRRGCTDSQQGQSCRKDENGRLSCQRIPRCKD